MTKSCSTKDFGSAQVEKSHSDLVAVMRFCFYRLEDVIALLDPCVASIWMFAPPMSGILTQWEILCCGFSSADGQLGHLLRCSGAASSLPSRPQHPSTDHPATCLCPLTNSFIGAHESRHVLAVSSPLPTRRERGLSCSQQYSQYLELLLNLSDPQKYLLDAYMSHPISTTAFYLQGTMRSP